MENLIYPDFGKNKSVASSESQGEVIEAKFAPDVPHISGGAKCVNCNHEWAAVAPVGTHHLECPECKFTKGAWYNPLVPKEYRVCECGCMHYLITRQAIMCARCAQGVHTWP